MSGDAYDRHVGRYSGALARALIEAVGVEEGSRALDVGCGPGALTAALADTLGPDQVAAVDPSEPFAAACRERVPGADVRVAYADRLPFEDGSFDLTLSQLVLNFVPDAPAALREMLRVTRSGGVVAACVWDYAAEMTMLRAFWDAAVAVDPDTRDLHEGVRTPYGRPDKLGELWRDAGLLDVVTGPIVVRASYAGFDDLWAPFTLGVGPAGAHTTSLGEPEREALRAEFHSRLDSPEGPFELSARAWMVRGRAPGKG